ncbi:hypothetical protein BJX70DRAFT_397252 [Aspergillus crustosus]
MSQTVDRVNESASCRSTTRVTSGGEDRLPIVEGAIVSPGVRCGVSLGGIARSPFFLRSPTEGFIVNNQSLSRQFQRFWLYGFTALTPWLHLLASMNGKNTVHREGGAARPALPAVTDAFSFYSTPCRPRRRQTLRTSASGSSDELEFVPARPHIWKKAPMQPERALGR